MNWYSDYKTEWKEIIETVSLETKRTMLMIEKDTIQTMFLNELSKETIPFVFKGGTSLSKAFNLIKRFSEDIDLSINRPITQSERKSTKKIIIGICERLGMVLSNPGDIFSNHDYNKYIFTYESLFTDVPQEIIIETSYYLTAFPCEKLKIHSFVMDFCRENGIDFPIPFEAADCTINVQSLERTLIDKVFAICDYRIQDMQDRDSRHLYDISKLLTHVTLDDSLKPLIKEVRSDRLKLKNNPAALPQYNITEMLCEIIESRFYEPDYRDITERLLYEDISYEEAVENGIAIVAKSALF